MTNKNKRIQSQATKFVNDKTLASTARFVEIANKYGMSPVTLAVVWSMNFDFVASTIIGARKLSQLDESLKALEVKLSSEILEEIKKKYIQR